MARITIEKGNKTVYRYDAGSRAFKKAAILLLSMASAMIVAAIVWFTQFMEL